MYYEVPYYKIPKGYKLNDFIKVCICNIHEGNDEEYYLDALFRVTYPIVINDLKRYDNYEDVSELLPDMSIAFMKTVRYYDPENSKASFLNYYKTTMGREIIQFRTRHRGACEETREMAIRCEKTKSSLDEQILENNEKATLGDILEDANVNIEDEIIAEDLKQEILRIVPTLFPNPSQKTAEKIFEYYIGTRIEGIRIKNVKIAEFFEMSPQYVSRVIIKNTEKLYRRMEKEGLI